MHQSDADEGVGTALSGRQPPLGYFPGVLDRLAEGVVVQGASGGLLSCNPAAERLLGLSMDQLSGLAPMDPAWSCELEDGSPLRTWDAPALDGLRRGEAGSETVVRLHKPGGEETWLSMRCHLLCEPGCTRPHAVMTCLTDVSSARRASQRARECEQELTFAMECAHIGTWWWDVATGNVRWSAQTERIFGVRPGELHSYDDYLALVHPEDREEMASRIAHAVSNEGAEHYHVEHRIIRPDGEQRWIAADGFVRRGADGYGTRIDGTVTDVTDRRGLEAQLTRAQRMEMIGRLAGGIAHDFNNLLTAIVGCTELARGAQRPPQLHEALDGIEEASSKAARLTTQLLTFARRRASDMRVLDLVELTQGIQRLLTRVIGDDVEVRTEFPPDATCVRADPSHIEQLLVNLAVNAREAMPAGGTFSIRVSAEEVSTPRSHGLQAGHYVLLEVSDTGTGIDRQSLPMIFDPFFTTKELGTGLGLATCYGIVTQLGGGIDVESSPGEGTHFFIRIPQSMETPPPTAVTRASHVPTGQRGRILLVEDDPMVLSVAERGLAVMGFEVATAGSGSEAMQSLRTEAGRFDVMVTDVVMPRMNGYELAQRVRKHHPELPIIFVSGYAEDARATASAVDAAQLPDTQHLEKPYTLEALGAAVRRTLAPPS